MNFQALSRRAGIPVGGDSRDVRESPSYRRFLGWYSCSFDTVALEWTLGFCRQTGASPNIVAHFPDCVGTLEQAKARLILEPFEIPMDETLRTFYCLHLMNRGSREALLFFWRAEARKESTLGGSREIQEAISGNYELLPYTLWFPKEFSKFPHYGGSEDTGVF